VHLLIEAQRTKFHAENGVADVVEIKMNFVLNQHASLKFGFRRT